MEPVFGNVNARNVDLQNFDVFDLLMIPKTTSNIVCEHNVIFESITLNLSLHRISILYIAVFVCTKRWHYFSGKASGMGYLRDMTGGNSQYLNLCKPIKRLEWVCRGGAPEIPSDLTVKHRAYLQQTAGEISSDTTTRHKTISEALSHFLFSPKTVCSKRSMLRNQKHLK